MKRKSVQRGSSSKDLNLDQTVQEDVVEDFTPSPVPIPVPSPARLNGKRKRRRAVEDPVISSDQESETSVSLCLTLDNLESFYDDVEMIPADDLVLPAHLEDLAFYPDTNYWKDPDPTATTRDNNLWFLYCIDGSKLDKMCLGKEFKLVQQLTIRVPKIVKNSNNDPVFEYENKYGQFYRIEYTNLNMSFQECLSQSEAIEKCLASNSYFKQKFPASAFDRDWTWFRLRFPAAFDKEGLLAHPSNLIERSSVFVSRLVDSDVAVTDFGEMRSVPCPILFERFSSNYFKAFCRSRRGRLVVDYYLNLTNFVEINHDLEQLQVRKSLREPNKFDCVQRAFTTYLYLGLLSKIRKVSDIAKLTPSDTVDLDSIGQKILTWMLDMESVNTKHTLQQVEGSLILRFDALPGRVVNLNEHSIETKVSRQLYEISTYCFGALLFTKSLSDVNYYAPMLALFMAVPQEDFKTLSMTKFQAHFLLPSKATLILCDSDAAVHEWGQSIKKCAPALNVIHVASIAQYRTVSWEAIMFADIILLCDRNMSETVPHLRYQDRPCDAFLNARSNVPCDAVDKEPSSLADSKAIIRDLSRLPEKGRVDFQAFYYRRVIYVHPQIPRHIFASDFKWIIAERSFETVSRVLPSLYSNSLLRSFYSKFALLVE